MLNRISVSVGKRKLLLWQAMALLLFAFLIQPTALAATFGSATHYGVIHPLRLATGDFNGDGRADLATTNYEESTVTILLNDGNGGLSTAATVPTGGHPGVIAVGDFNGDNNPDLAISNGSAVEGTNERFITILLGDGSGVNWTSSSVNAGNDRDVNYLVSGHFDGDQFLDLAVAKELAGIDHVQILKGDGSGGFTDWSSTDVGNYPLGIAQGFFNNDVHHDLAVANYWDNTITILIGNGDGTFAASLPIPVGTGPSFILASDFNGDLLIDLAVANSSGNSITLFLGNGDGTFTQPPGSPLATAGSPSAIAAGDFDGDGPVDLAVANYGAASVSLFPGTGLGTFGARQDFGVGSGPGSIVAADFNGDGKIDVATSNFTAGTVSVLTFGTIAGAAVTNNASDDGNSDLAIDSNNGNVHLVYERGGTIYYRSNSGGTWSSEETVAAGTGPAIAVNSTGSPHVVFLSGGGVFYTLRSGEEWAAPTIIHSGSYADIDVDQNGTVHIVYQGDTDGGGYDDIAYTNNATGVFAAPIVAIDGWYEYWGGGSATARYYSLPSIKADNSGFYHIAAVHHAIDRASGWTDHNYYIVYSSNNPGAAGADSGSFGNNAGVTKTKNAIALKPEGGYEVVYHVGSTIYRFPRTEIASGSQPSVSVDPSEGVHMAYVNTSSGIAYRDPDGSTLTIPTSTGRNPVVVAGDKAHMIYEASDGGDYEIYYLAVGPSPAVTPASHDFGGVLLGSSSASQAFTISNNGTSAISISDIALSDETNYSLDAAGCGTLPVTLGPGSSCAVSVTFIPQEPGILPASLEITLDEEEDALDVPIIGTGLQEFSLSISKAGAGSGTVTSGDGHISCGSACDSLYTEGAVVVLTATPASNSHFSGWSGGGCSGTDSCTVTVDASKTVTATFALKSYTMSASVLGGHGTVSCTTPVSHGSNSVCTITPDAGYGLSALSDNGSDVLASASGNSYTIVNVTANHTITASFAANDGPDLNAGWTRLMSRYVGREVRGTLRVNNSGNQAAGSFQVSLSLSDNGINQGSLLGTYTLYNLAAGGSVNIPYVYSNRSSISGKYIIAVVDAYGQVQEIDETNNTAAVLIP